MRTVPHEVGSLDTPVIQATVVQSRRMLLGLFWSYRAASVSAIPPFATFPSWALASGRTRLALVPSGLPFSETSSFPARIVSENIASRNQEAIQRRDLLAATAFTRNLWELCNLSVATFSITLLSFGCRQHIAGNLIPSFFGWQGIRREVMLSWSPNYS